MGCSLTFVSFFPRAMHGETFLSRVQCAAYDGVWSLNPSYFYGVWSLNPSYFHLWCKEPESYFIFGVWSLNPISWPQCLFRGLSAYSFDDLSVYSFYFVQNSVAQ